MKFYVSGLFLLAFIVEMSSCQKEVEGTIDERPTDSTAHIVSAYRVVDIDVASTPQDSIVRLFKTIMTGNEKTVEVSVVYGPTPADTVRTTFSYNTQGQLIKIKEINPLTPSVILSNTSFTWNAGRLTKAVFDTMGVFEKSVDFIYIPSGANTLIRTIETPSTDYILPDYFYKYKHSLTVNSQFLPVAEQWITHAYYFQGGLPQNIHDTANIIHTLSGGDLTASVTDAVSHDTSGAGGTIINIERDTSTYTYSRSIMGVNITDSLKAIYGSEIYTMMNFDLLDLYPIFTIYGPQTNRYFFCRPLNTTTSSNKKWKNGVYQPGQSYSNLLEKKITNSFDAQQRLTRSDIYEDFISANVVTVIKVYY
jgi:hypothetical protein